jgi:tetratricopeptide (TPR) repeat protein
VKGTGSLHGPGGHGIVGSMKAAHLLRALTAAVIILLASCVTVPPEDELVEEPEAYDSIALHLSQGQIEDAIAAFEEAYSRDPEDPETKVLYSTLLMTAGDLAQARQTLEGVLASGELRPDALYNLALIDGAQGDDDAKRERLEKALEIDPAYLPALAAQAEQKLDDGDLEGAGEAFEAVLEVEEDNLVALLGIAEVSKRENDPAGARGYLDTAVESYPDYVFARVDRSQVSVALGDYELALADLDTAIDLDPGYYWHYVDRGQIHALVRDYDRAEADFSTAIELDEDYFYGYVLRGDARIELGDMAGAFADLITVRDRRPDYPYTGPKLGYVALLAGEYETATQESFQVYVDDERRSEYLLLGGLGMIGQGVRRDFAELTAGLPRNRLEYHVARSIWDPGYEVTALRFIQDEDDRQYRARMLCYMGILYYLEDRPRLALPYLIDVKESLPPTVLERRLAEWVVNDLENSP